jgi:hypothetical protein
LDNYFDGTLDPKSNAVVSFDVLMKFSQALAEIARA